MHVYGGRVNCSDTCSQYLLFFGSSCSIDVLVLQQVDEFKEEEEERIAIATAISKKQKDNQQTKKSIRERLDPTPERDDELELTKVMIVRMYSNSCTFVVVHFVHVVYWGVWFSILHVLVFSPCHGLINVLDHMTGFRTHRNCHLIFFFNLSIQYMYNCVGNEILMCALPSTDIS